MAKVQVNINGALVDVEKMDFTSIDEPWSTYRLADGTTVKMKLVVTDILKMPGRDPVTGQDQFMIRSSNVAAVEPPPKTGKH